MVMCLLAAGFLEGGSVEREIQARHTFGPGKLVQSLKFEADHNDEARLLPKQIPVICYHNIKPDIQGDATPYMIGTDEFRRHMKMLSDSGYETILPDQLYQYLVAGATVPQKAVMITFDDSHKEHFSIAAPILGAYGFKVVFFVMTVTIGKPGYLSAAEIKGLSDHGHVIGCHTWDHQNLIKLVNKDCEIQISQPRLELERITGKDALFFAYPYGVWNEKAIAELKKAGIKAAFQLSEKQSEQEPLYTIRRILVPGTWSANTLYRSMHSMFK